MAKQPEILTAAMLYAPRFGGAGQRRKHPEVGTSTFSGFPVKLSQAPMTARKHAPFSVKTPGRYSESLVIASRRSGSDGGQE